MLVIVFSGRIQHICMTYLLCYQEIRVKLLLRFVEPLLYDQTINRIKIL